MSGARRPVAPAAAERFGRTIHLADGAAITVRVLQVGTRLEGQLLIHTSRAEPLALAVPGYAVGDLVRALSYAAGALGQRP